MRVVAASLNAARVLAARALTGGVVAQAATRHALLRSSVCAFYYAIKVSQPHSCRITCLAMPTWIKHDLVDDGLSMTWRTMD